MTFKKYVEDEKFRNLLINFSLLNERENDDKFRNQVNQIYQHILNKIKSEEKSNIYQIGRLTIIFMPINNIGITAFYSNKKNTITINTNSHIELYKSDIVEFVEEHKYQLFHEIVHFLDDVYGDVYRAHETQTGVETPKEWNAYFHMFIQIFEDNYRKLRNIKSVNPVMEFAQYFGNDVEEFIKKFWSYIIEITNKNEHFDIKPFLDEHPKEKFRWNKRIFQTYYELREKYLTKEAK